MKHKYNQSFKTFSLIVIFILFINTMNINAFGSNTFKSNQIDKIDDELYNEMTKASENDLIPVWIYMESIDDKIINKRIIDKEGIDPKVYENKELFNKEVKPQIENQVISEFQNSDKYKNNSQQFKNTDINTDEISSTIKKQIAEKYSNYLEVKREITKSEYVTKNSAFLMQNTPQNRKVIYKGNYSPTIIIEATKSEIFQYANIDSVEKISLYVPVIEESDMSISLKQVGVYCDGGTGYDVPDGWLAYNGLGMKVGILEAEGGKYDSTSIQLKDNANLEYIDNIRTDGTVVANSVSNHATIVTSIIAGQRSYALSRYYTGVVPRATVYQSSVYYGTDVFTGIQHLVDRGVYVINYSGGSSNPVGNYTSYEKELDNIIKNTGIIFVKSAGNDGNATGYVTRGATSFNSIVVGNANTKPSAFSSYSAPYNMSNSSSYKEADYLPNKPDISAPGTEICIADSSMSVIGFSGTSFSAPTVAGIVTQMLQAEPSLIGNPTAVKTLLLLGAEESKITTENNELVGNCLREKSGAGFVNAINAVNNAFALNVFTCDVTPHYQIETEAFYCNAGQKIRAVMVFDKRNDLIISSNLDIETIDLDLAQPNSYNLVSFSSSGVNNVEIIECTIPESGYYHFIATPWSVVDEDNPPRISLAYRIYN